MHPRQLAQNHAKVLGALRNLLPGELLHRQRIGPIVGQRADVIQPVSERHGPQVAHSLGQFFVVAVQVPEDRLQTDYALPVQSDVHAEDAVGRRVVRPHGHFQQFPIAIRLHHRRPVPAFRLILLLNECTHSHWPAPVPSRFASAAECAVARASTSSCAVGSYSKSSGST